ncbi:universal stress protein [Streptomyces kronopolitis]|uniref:universal stress protein n=1 Tax=Streptomyces kronopolitis TaxID=1612435 RepID=UPI003557FFC1
MSIESTRCSRRIVVGVHGTHGSVQALRYAAYEARQRQATLTVVNAWIPAGGEGAERVTPCPELCSTMRERARLDIEEACRQAKVGDDLAVEKCVVRGSPGEVLTRVAQQEGDMLVLGAPRQRLVGSLRRTRIIKYCLLNCHFPVVVVAVPSD